MGCFQKAGVDCTDTYASVMATRTFRYLLQLYNSEEENSMEHWDVSTAFIHAPEGKGVDETSHWTRSEGQGVVGVFVKALYGTKQAANAWQQHLRKLMVEDEFNPLILDPATYVKRKGLLGTHVDDLFVVSNLGRSMKVPLSQTVDQNVGGGKVDLTNAYPT